MGANIINHGSVRLNTRAGQAPSQRSSSNYGFQEQFRTGLKNGIDVANSTVRHIAGPIPGSAALSASLSDAARSLSAPSGIAGSGITTPGAAVSTGADDLGSLQHAMLKNTNEMLDKQLQVSQFVTSVTMRSNLIKAFFDALKTIGSNLR